MARVSAGLMMYRVRGGTLEVLLAHPGGPFWSRKDLGAWSIPKGLIEEGEEPLAAARREFTEETGFATPEGAEGAPYLPLGSVKQRGGKTVHAWAFEGDCDPEKLSSIDMQLEWPPKSGKSISVPELDQAAWYAMAAAREKMLASQSPFLERISDVVKIG